FVSPSQGLAPVGVADRSLLSDELAIFGLPIFILGSLFVIELARWAGAIFAYWCWHTDLPERYVAAPAWPWLLGHARTVGAALAIWPRAVLVLLPRRTPDSRVWTLFWCLALIAGASALALRHLLPIRPTLAEDDSAAPPVTATPALQPSGDLQSPDTMRQ